MSEAKDGPYIFDGTVLTQYVGSWQNVVVPDGFEVIGSNAFRSLDKLRSVTLPASIRRIGSGAFADCPSLYFVYLSTLELPKIEDGAFTGSPVCYLMTADGVNRIQEVE